MVTRRYEFLFHDGEGNPFAGYGDVTVTPPVPPGGRINVRTYNWNAIGRPNLTTTRTGSSTPLAVYVNGTDLIGADILPKPAPGSAVGAGIMVTGNTNLVSDVNCGGSILVYTGKHLKMLRNSSFINSGNDGIGPVDNVQNCRVENFGNDGYKPSLGGGYTHGTSNPIAGAIVPHLGEDIVVLNRGFLPAGSAAHADNLQLWSGWNYAFRRMFLGAMPGPYPAGSGRVNSLIIIKSDIDPWDGSRRCIENVLFEDVYLDLSVGNGYNVVIYVREGSGTGTGDNPNLFQRRPKMVTFRGLVVSNMPSGAKPTNGVLMSTAYQTDHAVFVQTDAIRAQGIANQTADPSVIGRRVTALSPSRNGKCYPDLVDARSWIVWEDCQYQDGTQIGCPAPGGFYNLAAG